MPIVSSEIAKVFNRPGGDLKVHERHIDHLGGIWEYRYLCDATFDKDAALAENAARIEADIPQREAEAQVERSKKGVTLTAEYQTQAELDRRTIVQLMQVSDSLTFGRSLQWFRDFEVRAGANANARANYLGVSSQEYSEVADRFNQITGVINSLEADQGRVWIEPPAGWE